MGTHAKRVVWKEHQFRGRIKNKYTANDSSVLVEGRDLEVETHEKEEGVKEVGVEGVGVAVWCYICFFFNFIHICLLPTPI